jgi:1,2-phenylacetyl-CoA epoxidase PaaB subunit
MEKKSRNFKKWERFLKKDKDLSPDIDISVCAQLLATQEKFEKRILEVAKENFKRRKNVRRKSSKRNGKN